MTMEDQSLAALKAQIDAFDAILNAQAIDVADAVSRLGAAAPQDEEVVADLRAIVIQSLEFGKYAESFAKVMAARIVFHYRTRMIEQANAALQAIDDDQPGKELPAAGGRAKGAHQLHIVREDVEPKE
jgi:hypothetical protein